MLLSYTFYSDNVDYSGINYDLNIYESLNDITEYFIEKKFGTNLHYIDIDVINNYKDEILSKWLKNDELFPDRYEYIYGFSDWLKNKYYYKALDAICNKIYEENKEVVELW